MDESIEISWDISTAYDLFISLEVLHDPNRYGLRGAWAAGVRSRLPADEREILQTFVTHFPWPLSWVHKLAPPKDCATALLTLEKAGPQERFASLAMTAYYPGSWEPLLREVSSRGAWTPAELQRLLDIVAEQHPEEAQGHVKEVRKLAEGALTGWSMAASLSEGLLPALRSYYDVFFCEEEARIRPALEAGLARAQETAAGLPLDSLIEELSQGVRLEKDHDKNKLVLAPSFWATPFLVFAPLDDETELRIFGVRPPGASLVPGEMVPDALFQALKALADPTRLRILYYLSQTPQTPAELARRLRLRPPTVIHHLDALRLARLVYVTLGPDGRRFAARREAIEQTGAMLEAFLDSGTQTDLDSQPSRSS
jgi:DNA-binding transcriptional ArsR family regulator